MINWKVRAKSKVFWLALIPAVLVLVQVCAAPFGYQWDFAGLQSQLIAIVNAVFVLLAILGVVVDPTTAGIGDSERAMSYEVPYGKHVEADHED
jgi:phi LC3 family holin